MIPGGPPKESRHFHNSRTPKHGNRRRDAEDHHRHLRVDHGIHAASPYVHEYGPPYRSRGYYDYYEGGPYRYPPYDHHVDRDGGMEDGNSLRAVSSSFSANSAEKLLQMGVAHSLGAEGHADAHMDVVAGDSNSIETEGKNANDVDKYDNDSHLPSPSTKAESHPRSSPSNHSDSSWKQLQQIASIDSKEHEHDDQNSPKPINHDHRGKENESSPNEPPEIKQSISHASSLSNSPTDQDQEEPPFSDPAKSTSSHHYRNNYYDSRPYTHRLAHPKIYPKTNTSSAAPPDENSPSSSTISTKDTRPAFFSNESGMKHKHPVHLKTSREEHEIKRRKLDDDKRVEDDSPANGSDPLEIANLRAVPSWDTTGRALGGLSVCSGMTGVESLIRKDLTQEGVLSAFSFSSEKREENESPDGRSILSKGRRRGHHVQFHPDPGKKRAVPGRYHRPPPEEYPHEYPPPHYPPQYEYPHSPPRYHPRYYPREPYEDEYYEHYPPYHPPPPRYYDVRYRPPPPPPPQYRHDYPEYMMRPPVTCSGPPGTARSMPGGWSKEDDLELMDFMKKHKNVKNWEPIAKKLNIGKSGAECQDRWNRFLKPGTRKGQWTEAEDRIVFDAVSNTIEDPFTRWSDLAQQLPGRVGKQVRDRWVNHLNPAINHLPFSREDDIKLWEGHNVLGKRWVEISAKYFESARSENHIKNRWYSASFKKFVGAEFGPDAYKIGNEKGGMGDAEMGGEGIGAEVVGEKSNEGSDCMDA